MASSCFIALVANYGICESSVVSQYVKLINWIRGGETLVCQGFHFARCACHFPQTTPPTAHQLDNWVEEHVQPLPLWIWWHSSCTEVRCLYSVRASVV